MDRQHYLGNLLQTPLTALATEPRFAAFAAAKSDYGDACRSCDWLSLCCGGCQKHRLFGHGRVNAPSYLCVGYQRLFTHAWPRLQQVAEEYRAGRPPPTIN